MIGIKEKFRQKVIQSILTVHPEWQVEISSQNGCINFDNLYPQVQLHREPKQTLIQHFLSKFDRFIRDLENPSGNFDEIKNRISLVVRPIDFYSECLASDDDKQLAFSLPVLPDLALYLIDNTNSWRYITNAQFSKWKVSSGEVLWWAYKNTCKAERCLKMGRIGEVGLLITTDRKSGTISPFLYEPRNFQILIHSVHPEWTEQSYWVCIPVPHLIIITKEGHDGIIRRISLSVQKDYGKALSNRIYIFANNDFVGEVIRRPGRKEPTVVTLEGNIPEPVLPD